MTNLNCECNLGMVKKLSSISASITLPRQQIDTKFVVGKFFGVFRYDLDAETTSDAFTGK
jgi:hypothetical protein